MNDLNLVQSLRSSSEEKEMDKSVQELAMRLSTDELTDMPLPSINLRNSAS